MKNTFGNSVCVTLFGESHGKAIGAVIDGLAPGIEINDEYINRMLDFRRPHGKISTPRKETDSFSIISGVLNGKTTGTPLTIIIPNENTKSEDYDKINGIARPSHADFAAECKYHGFQDARGGGHFSGRITAALVAVGAVCKFILEQKNIYIGTHIKKCAGIADREFDDLLRDIKTLNEKEFAVLDEEYESIMKKAITDAAENNDSVGGVLETAIVGMPAGIGEPWFDSVEGMLSHMIFSIPAVKGIEFGAGFNMSDMLGSAANDPFTVADGKIGTLSNNNGGINGGITNGMPIIFRTAIKPTPTISKPQQTVDYKNMINTVIEAGGRHDPAIVHRARVVQDSVAAIVMCDMLAMRYGTDWLK